MFNIEDAQEKLNGSSVPTSWGCLRWTGRLNSDGYGIMSVVDADTGQEFLRGAHRVAVEIVHGEVLPSGYQIHHACVYRACVNTEHLHVLTNDENRAERAQRQRATEKEVRDLITDGTAYMLNGEIQAFVAEWSHKLRISPDVVRKIMNMNRIK